MKTHLISGGCGFVGRNMVKRLYNNTQDRILFIDNLSVGKHPSEWLKQPLKRKAGSVEIYGEDELLLFIQEDFRVTLNKLVHQPGYLKNDLGLDIDRFADVYHFAAIVGGRAMIDGDPIQVALDLSIDAEFFFWVSRHKPQRVLYPSSSAAYPVSLQTQD